MDKHSTAGLLRKPQVTARTGLSPSEIYRREKRGDFPKRIRLGQNVTVWSEAEVDTWVQQVIAGRGDGLDDARARDRGRFATEQDRAE